MKLLRGAVLAVILCLGVGMAVTAQAQKAKRAVIISWDGAADWVVDRLLAEGKLPNVARLLDHGSIIRYWE